MLWRTILWWLDGLQLQLLWWLERFLGWLGVWYFLLHALLHQLLRPLLQWVRLAWRPVDPLGLSLADTSLQLLLGLRSLLHRPHLLLQLRMRRE